MTRPHRRDGPYATPSQVVAEEGEVFVDGPDAVAVSFTPDAARETSDRLLEAVAKARGQQLRRERREGKASKPGTV